MQIYPSPRHHVCEGHGRRCWTTLARECPSVLVLQVVQEPLWLLLYLKLRCSLRPVITEDGDKTSASSACWMLRGMNSKGGGFFVDKQMVGGSGGENQLQSYKYELLLQQKLYLSALIIFNLPTLNWRDRDWACSTGERQLLYLICVGSQVRLMEMVEIMEHRALK